MSWRKSCRGFFLVAAAFWAEELVNLMTRRAANLQTGYKAADRFPQKARRFFGIRATWKSCLIPPCGVAI